ncbi:unnamed protein product [Clonostachys rosea]|uniref:Trichodiene oxygenase n=1 Tax=Bionectria ochroleuca TaxID=29856 RepID=A0ABY6UCR5_BIOOC|nr:unnamed protein product [Clonostachys rosea]
MSSVLTVEGAWAFVSLNNALLLLALWLGHRVVLALYNISPFHPLYSIPGPRLAAASYLYETWYDLILVGRYTWEIKAMHEKYGPIVRINPDEVHCDDYSFVEEIYPSNVNRIRDKQPHFLAGFAGPLSESSFAARYHELTDTKTHRIRRSAISKFFSRQGMLRYEPEVHELAQKMCSKLLRLTENGQIMKMADPFNCFTADTISQYCFGESFGWPPLKSISDATSIMAGFLDRPDFERSFKKAFESVVSTSHVFRHIPILRHLVGILSVIGPYLGSDMAFMVESMNETIPNHIIRAQQQKSVSSPRVFTEIMNSPIPEKEKTIYRLSGEGWSLVTAGSETTASTLCAITYFLLSDREKLARLREELKDEDPHKLSWVQLEKYPYLHGVVFETLRVALGISVRTTRIAREEDLVYNNRGFSYVIPRGATIGMSAFINHNNEEIFPDPHKFEPGRWITAQGKPDYAMEKYILSFSKGSRQCIGMSCQPILTDWADSLAFCELYLATAAMALRVLPHLELHDTVYEDIKYDHDALTPQPKKGARGVRVRAIDAHVD